MKKQIEEFLAYLQKELDRLETRTVGKQQSEQAQALWTLYQQRIEDFKHERFIHLIVTLFFAAAVLVALGAAVLMPLLEMLPGVEISVLTMIGSFSIVLILLVVEVFYIRHYFFLENTIQKLYLYEQRIVELVHDDTL